MGDVPWWGVVSSAVGPLVLVGGWTVAARLQPPSFDPVADTVSALAAVGAPGRWVMTVTFVVVAVCDVVTAAALRPARAAGRLILVAGSVAGMLAAVNPQHGGGSLPHAIWASISFGGMAFWPAAAWRRGPVVPWGLRPVVCAGAVAALATLTAWFGAEVATGPGRLAWPSSSSAWRRHCGFSPWCCHAASRPKRPPARRRGGADPADCRGWCRGRAHRLLATSSHEGGRKSLVSGSEIR